MFDKENRASGILEIELPTGIRIAECTGCHGNVFLMDLRTVCEVKVSHAGLLAVDRPRLSIDLVAERLKPENLTCARCFDRKGGRKNETDMHCLRELHILRS